jgi:hypothetical protein
MCLISDRLVTRNPHLPDDPRLGLEDGEGWKVFTMRATSNGIILVGEMFGGEPRPEGKWLNEKDFRLRHHALRRVLETDDIIMTYPYGWHVFRNREDAEEWGVDPEQCLRKVRFRKAGAAGFQKVGRGRNMAFKPVVVAKEIFILPEDEDA